jgi:branched-chain amino acid transport system ATP-binding protein
VHEVSLTVGAGEIVAIVGANGAGKSTTLKTIVGEVKQFGGSIHFDGKPVPNGRSYDLARRGLMLVPEHRSLFGSLTVEENLQMGTWVRKYRAGFTEDEQQMLAIARALMGAPRLLMLDEPSTGLSPKLTWEVFHAINEIRNRGVSILLVEQNAGQVLELADRAYVMESGSVVLEGTGSDLAADERVQSAYLGV